MSHPNTDPELLPVAPLTVNDVMHPHESEFYIHSRTGDILRCSDEEMERRKRGKEKRLAEEAIEKEKIEARKEQARERAKQYGK